MRTSLDVEEDMKRSINCNYQTPIFFWIGTDRCEAERIWWASKTWGKIERWLWSDEWLREAAEAHLQHK